MIWRHCVPSKLSTRQCVDCILSADMNFARCLYSYVMFCYVLWCVCVCVCVSFAHGLGTRELHYHNCSVHAQKYLHCSFMSEASSLYTQEHGCCENGHTMHILCKGTRQGLHCCMGVILTIIYFQCIVTTNHTIMHSSYVIWRKARKRCRQ